MKTKKITTLILSAFIVLTIVSCSDDEESTERNYLDEITGTYVGEFSSLKTTTENTAIADVTLTSNDQLEIHCYGDLMDTTMIMDAFEHNDSVMICYTGDDFYHEYGHMGNGHHMMDMGMNQSEWMHHLEDDHTQGDQHYGGFNMKNHSFTYSFKMMDGNTTYMLEFNGMKQ